MNNREKQRKLREASIKKNKENQKLQKGAIGRTKNSNSSINKVVEKKKSSVKKGGPTKAQQMAKANIKKYGGTAKAAAANKAAMKLKIKKAYQAKKKKK